jgi:hypothetical protein
LTPVEGRILLVGVVAEVGAIAVVSAKSPGIAAASLSPGDLADSTEGVARPHRIVVRRQSPLLP